MKAEAAPVENCLLFEGEQKIQIPQQFQAKLLFADKD
jgi:hypothetical protein